MCRESLYDSSCVLSFGRFEQRRLRMNGYKITKIVDSGQSDGDFAVVVQVQNGETAALALPWEQVVDLSRLLLSAIAHKKGRELFFEMPEDLRHRDRTTTIEVSEMKHPAWPGTFLCKLLGEDGAAITLAMPHETAVEWRNDLSTHIDAFVRTKAN
jgi:hypothetical protein